jgi:hypothetical protein
VSCPANPPAPQGYDVWKGAVPPVLTAWCVGLLKTANQYPFGQTWTQEYNGQTIIARLDRHTWHYLPDGTLLTNLCWRGLTLYRPLPVGGPQGASVVTNIETATPDPTLAVYDQVPRQTDWLLVAECGAVIAVFVTGFLLAIKYAGHPGR